MKTIFAAAIAMLGSASVAIAADLPVKAPPAPAAWNWSGFYLGANLGGGFTGANSYNYIMPFTAPGNIGGRAVSLAELQLWLEQTHSISRQSVRRVQRTCWRSSRIQLAAGSLAFGLEADGNWQKAIANSFYRFGTNLAVGAPLRLRRGGYRLLSIRAGFFGTFRGRIGWSGGNWLVYGTGGLAFGGVRNSTTEILNPGTSCLVAPSAGCRNTANSATNFGWTVGAGTELMLDRSWSVGLEYLYVDLGSSTVTLAALPLATSPFFFNPSTVK